MDRFLSTFQTPKMMLGMLHLGGRDPADVSSIAEEEARVLAGEGLDGVIVENYFGTADRVLERICALDLGCRVGVNVLGSTDAAFGLARRHAIDLIQIDSVCGHLRPEQDRAFAAELALAVSGAPDDLLIIGGVRFKYQPVRSGRGEREDVVLGAARCDAIV